MIPRKDYVLIKRTIQTKEVKQGTILLSAEPEKTITNVVVAMGELVENLAVNQKVLLKNFNEEYKVGEDLVLVKESDIIAIMEDKDEQ